jgi:hypothetical protein
LDSAMRSLSSLLSRAFFDHLLSNPVGWQFIYRKHDPNSPSIRMHPTSYTLADLTPHGRNICTSTNLMNRSHLRLLRMYCRLFSIQSTFYRTGSVDPLTGTNDDHKTGRKLVGRLYPADNGRCR